MIRNAINNFHSKLGQATTEMAIFGVIVLVIFGALLRYGQMFNAQQEAKMMAFRKSIEMAKARYDDRRLGQVSMQVMKEYYPVDLFGSTPKKAYAGGSASVIVDSKQSSYRRKDSSGAKPWTVLWGDWEKAFGIDNGDPDRTDYGATYYQTGQRMVDNNKLIEAPYMKVHRKVDDSKGPHNPADFSLEWMSALSGSDKEYVSYETAPVQEQSISSSEDATVQENVNENNGKRKYAESITSDTDTNTTSQIATWNDVDAMDKDKTIISKDYLPPNMVVEEREKIEKSISYSAGY